MSFTDKDHAFLAVYNDLIRYPSSAAVALALGLSASRVRARICELRRMAEVADNPPYIAVRYNASVPMSEHSERFKPNWTGEDCIAELRRVAAMCATPAIARARSGTWAS